MKRPEESNPKINGQSARVPFADAAWEERFPQVCEYLTVDAYDDGSTRERSSLTLKSQDGKVMAMLNDPTVRRSLYRVGNDVAQAIDALEDALSGPNCDWRTWKQDFGSARKGKR